MATQTGPSGFTATLRYTAIFAFFYALPTAIPYATEGRRYVPAIGLVFLACSTLQSLIVLRSISGLRKIFSRNKYEYRIVLNDSNTSTANDGNNDQECASMSAQNEGIRKIATGTLLAMSDCALALIHAFFFSFTIVEMVATHDWDHFDILGTFTSLAYLVVFFAHTILATVGIYKLSSDLKYKDLTRCANCHASIFARTNNGQQVSCPSVSSPAAPSAGRVQSEPGTTAANDESGSPRMTGAYAEQSANQEQLVNTEEV